MDPTDRREADVKADLDATRGLSEAPEGEDPRLLAAVQAYLAALEAGKRPNRQEFLARYPEIAPALSDCLDGLAFVHSAAAQMQGAASGAAEGDAALSRPLGDFRLIREIGRGGMGVVYEAVQLSLGRRVAVKVLPFAAALDSRCLQRFRNEAQAAAQLHHTNIVPVYAVGCERSVHYYAMQLIEGQSLADVIRGLRAAAGHTPPALPSAATQSVSGSSETGVRRGRARSGLSGPTTIPAENLSALRSSKRPTFFQAVARLGLQAAEALDYAHQQGVVHRDIKPENLLLDVKGNLWVTDFGLAQVYADSGLTQTGDLLGTLRYMSPEQASGRAVVLDQRTDIYSLGLTLYELLTLERAVPGETREQLLRQISLHEPRAPRLIDRAIPPELETILAKTTAKDPADRYATARALAEDLHRFLRDEPILARPPSAWDKAVKWTRRHRSVAMSGLAMLLLAAAGLLTSTVLIAREQAKTKAAFVRERDKAIEAEQQRTRAENSFKQARAAVDFFARIAAEEMDKPQFTDVRKELLEAALVYYQSFLADRKDDPSIGLELDAARARVSAILTELSAFDHYFRVQFRVRLLSEPPVQRELGLSPEQLEKVRQSGMEWSWRGPGGPGGPGGPEELRDLSPEQRREKFGGLASAAEAKLSSLLTSAQAQRLQQIDRQVRGVMAFSDPDVSEALGLSREQKEKMRTIQARARDARHRRGPWEESRSSPENVQSQAVGEIVTLLSEAQAQTWQALIGRPFTGSVFPHERGFGPPPRRRP